MSRFLDLSSSPILNSLKSSKRAASISMLVLAATSFAVTSGVVPITIASVNTQESAMAYQSWEHLWIDNMTYYSNGYKTTDQGKSNAFCLSLFRSIKVSGKGFVYFANENRVYFFAPWNSPSVWADVRARTCVVNF